MDNRDSGYYSTNVIASTQNLAEESYKDGLISLKIRNIDDVKNNLGSLGRGVKVLIWYILSASVTAMENNLRKDRIHKFACHLITYGFNVTIDMFCKHATEAEWAAWIDYEMSQADWIICVCSQSLYTMFQSVNDLEKGIRSLSLAEKNGRFYSRTLYNRLLNDTKLKVIPVVLLKEDDNLAFVPPTLRDPKNILYIYEDTPFCVENINGNFERLVCRMAGIDRMALKFAEQKNQGFVKLPSKIPKDDYYFEKATIPQPRVTNSDISSKKFYYGEQPRAMQNTPAFLKPSHQMNGHVHEPAARSVNTFNMHQQPVDPVDPTRGYYNQKTGAADNSFNHVPWPQSQYVPPQPSVSNKHHSRNWQTSQTQTNSYACNSNYSKQLSRSVQQKGLSAKDGLPDCKIPVDSPILWKLSQEVMEWKFLGRYLDLEEEIIEEIDYNTRPNKTRDKALKVLTEWVNSATPTWVALGQALLDAEYIMLYERLLELISCY